MSKKKIKPINLSDIKFYKNTAVSPRKLEKMIKNLNKTIEEIDEKRKISDYSKLHRPMTI